LCTTTELELEERERKMVFWFWFWFWFWVCVSVLPTSQLHIQQETAWLLVVKPGRDNKDSSAKRDTDESKGLTPSV